MALQAVSGGMGVLSSGNYLKMAKQVGKIVPVIGSEARATISRAGEVATQVLKKVDDTIQNTEMSTKRVIAAAEMSARGIIRAAGNEAQEVSSAVRDDLEEVLALASIESQYNIAKAGLELRGTILATEDAAKRTGLFLSSEVNAQIKEASNQAEHLLNKGKDEVSALLLEATQNLRGLGNATGEQFERCLTLSINKRTRSLNQEYMKSN